MSTPLLSFAELFTEQAHCPLCHANSSDAQRQFAVLQVKWPVDVLECPHCGLMFKRHFPTPRLMNIIYSDHYVHFAQANPQAKPDVPAEAPRPSSRLSRLGPVKGKLLDYGCGGGQFVREARQAGWDAYGCDPFLPDTLKQGEDASIYFDRDARQSRILELGQYDAISLWAVAEHLEDAGAVFGHLSQMLKPGGKLIFNSPNGASLIARLQGPQWSMAVLVEHIQFHTPRSLNFLADKLGMNIESRRFCGSPYPFGKTDIRNQGIPSWMHQEPGEPTPGPAQPNSMPDTQQRPPRDKLVKRLIKACIDTGNSESGLTNALRSAIHLSRIGDHLEVVMSKR